MIVPDVGGAFGSKGVIAVEGVVVALAAIELGRPVKWAEDRMENFVGAYQGRGVEAEVELALDADGRMLAVRADILADLGAFLLPTTAIPPHTTAMLMTGCYDDRLRRGDRDRRRHRQGADRALPRRRPPRGRVHARAHGRRGRARAGDRARRAAPAQPDPVVPAPRRRSAGRTTRATTRAASSWHSSSVVPERASEHQRVVGTGVAMYVERAGGQWESAG